MKARKVAGVTLAALVLLAGAGVAAVSWRSADALVHPARDASAQVPALPHERVSFAASDGVPLVGWWVPAPEARGVVVFLHGYGDSKDQSLPLLPFLHAEGYHVLAYDARAHGESGGDHTTVGLDEVQDVRGALAFAAARDPEAAENLALVGWSMGAATAILAAALEPSVDAVVADSSFATLQNIASNSITAFTGLPKYPFGPLSVTFAGWMVRENVARNAPLHAAPHVAGPMLVIQGLDDTIALPGEDGEAIARAAPAGSQLWLVPGAAHVQAHAVAPGEYERRVSAFLAERLSGGAA